MYNYIGSKENISDFSATPTLVGVAHSVAVCGGAKINEKQYITYEEVYNTFLLGLLDDGLYQSSIMHEASQESLAGHSTETQIEAILEELRQGELRINY